MSQQIIDTGNVAGDGSGDTLFVAFTKTNNNFTELYATVENQGLTYVNVAIGSTSGNGAGATFNVTRYVNEYSVTLNTNGTGFAANDTVTLWGNALGGDSSLNNVTLTVSTLANATVGNLATFTATGTPVQPVLTVAGRTGNVILTVNDVLGAVSPADLQSNIANAKVVVSGWISSNVNSISNLTNVSITNSTIVGGSIANATLSNVSGQFSTLNVSGLATISQLSVNNNAIFGGNILPAAGRGILFNDGSFQSTAATSTNLGPVNANVTAANAAIAALQSNAATQGAAIAALQGADFATNSALSSTNANVATLQSNAATQAGQITSLQTSLGGYATVSAVSATNANVTAANVEIGKLRANITAANAAIAALQSADFATNASVTAANAAITVLQSNAITQASQIAYANASISTLTSNAASQATALGSLESNAATQAGQIASLESNAATQASTLGSLASNASAQESRISSLTANAAGQSNEIAGLRANITAANSAISTLQSDSANYLTSANLAGYATVSQLSTNVASLNANDAQQGTQITALRANIEAANTAITTKASLSGATFTGNVSAPNVAISGQLDVTGNITVNSIDAVNVVNAATGEFNQVSGLLTTGTQTNITRVGTLANLTVTGNTTTGNVNATQGSFTSVQGTLLTNSQPNITTVGTLGNLTVTGRVTTANVTSSVVIAGRAEVASGNAVVTNFTATNLSAANVIIQDGLLDSVDIGNTTPGFGTFDQLIVAPGGFAYLTDVTANAISLTELTANNRIVAPILEGTLATDAQPNILTVGNLSQLTVDGTFLAKLNAYVVGNVISGNVEATRGSFDEVGGILLNAVQTNITTVGTLGNLAVAGTATATTVSATNIVGTLQTAGQPNITSVGTLTNLDVSGNVSTGQDLTVTGNLYVLGNTTTVDTQQLVIADATITLGNGLPNAISANLGGIYLDGADASMLYLYTYDAWTFNKSIFTTANADINGYISVGSNVYLADGVDINFANAILGNVSLDYVRGTQATFVSVIGNLSAAFANATTVNATNITGTLQTAAQTNITSVGSLTQLTVTGNITNTTGNVRTGNLHVTNNVVVVDGNIEAVEGYFIGAIGTAVQTGITQVGTLTSLDVATTANVTGNLIAGNISATTGEFVEVSGTVLTNTQPHITTVGTLVDLDVTGNVVANTLSGTVLTASQPNITTVGNLTDLAVAGNISTVGNVDAAIVSANNLFGTLSGNASGFSANYTEITGTLQTAAQPNITTVGTLDDLDVAGNITTDTLSANSITTTNISGTLLTNAQPNITTVGTLTDLDVGGNIGVDVITANSIVGSVTGNISGNTAAFTNVTGTLQTAAQPNITTVGNLTNLDVVGNVTTGNISGNTAAFTNVTGTLQTAAQPNITTVGNLTNLNVIGNITSGNVSGTTAGFTNVTGTLQTVAQPNITTVGNLTNLEVAGNISTVGNIDAAIVNADNFFGTLSGNATGYSANYTEITGTLQTAAQTNITSVGNLVSLNVTGNVSAGNVSAATAQFSNIVGTLLTSSQPNITTVGTLGNLDVAGAVTADSFVGNFTISTLSANIVANLANIELGNITSLSGNISVYNIVLSSYISANTADFEQINLSENKISFFSNVNGLFTGEIDNRANAYLANIEIAGNSIANAVVANVITVSSTANIANLVVNNTANIIGNATLGNVSGVTATFTEIVGPLLTNAQPNITSVGNLTLLNVSNDLTVGGNIVLTGSFDASQGNVTLGAVTELNVTGNTSIQGTFTANSTSLFAGNAEFVSNIDLRGNLNFVDQAVLRTNSANVYLFPDSVIGNLYIGQNSENIWIGPTENTGLTRIGSLDANIVAVDTIAILGDTGFEANVAGNIYMPALTSFAPVVLDQLAFDSTGNISTNAGNVTANANLQYRFLSITSASTGVYSLSSEILGVPTGNTYLAFVTEAVSGGAFDQANSGILGGNAMVFSANVFYLPGGVPRGSINVPENSAGLSYVVIDPPTKLRDTGESLGVDQGALVVDGGVGIAKNLFIGGNISVQDNSTFAANITVGNVSITNKLELLSNIGLSLPNLDDTPIGQTTPDVATFTELNIFETRPNVRPLTFNLANGRRLDPRLNYTRAGNVSFINASGNLTFVGANTPPITFDANGVCQGLLIEPAATNLARGSNSFANATLYTSYGLNSGLGNAFVANSTTVSAPTGLLHAVELVEDSTTGYHGFVHTLGTALTTSQPYTVSLLVKANVQTQLSVSILGENDGPVFDILNGTIVSTGAANYTGADIQRIRTDQQGYHWYRVFATTTKSNVSVATDQALIFLANATGDITYTGTNGAGGATVFGLQIENSRYGTGYIESDATATGSRSAPTVLVTQANTAWAGNTVGTSVVIDAKLNHTRTDAIGSDQRYGLLSFQGSATERAVLYVEDDLTGRTSQFVAYQNSIQQVNGSNLSVTVGNVQSAPIHAGISIRYNDFSFVINGGTVQTDSNALPDTLFNVPVWSDMYVGSGAGVDTWNGTVRKIAIYPRKIVDGALKTTTRDE